MSERERIQKEVDRILDLASEDAWESFLWKKGCAHETYYHYTTLHALAAMVESSRWLLRRADTSNDPLENPIHNVSFTTSSLSSMGMWKAYAGMGETGKFGVRIELTAELVKEIFFEQNWERKDVQGNFTKLPPSAYSTEGARLYDIAYWYFGNNKDTDMVFYKGYRLIGKALHYHHKKDELFPPFFKGAAWRSEAEVRLCWRLNTKERDVYVPITEKQFTKMKFRLAPDLKNCFLSLFQNDILTPKQFIPPSEQEVWQDNGNNLSR